MPESLAFLAVPFGDNLERLPALAAPRSARGAKAGGEREGA